MPASANRRAREFKQGDAMALLIADASVDAATMALVIFFVPEPAKGVAEMMRDWAKGGSGLGLCLGLFRVAAFLDAIQSQVRAAGVQVLRGRRASRFRSLRLLHQLWVDGGLPVEFAEIVVERVFPSFEEYWRIGLLLTGHGRIIEAMPADTVAAVRERVRAGLRIENGKVIHTGRASAVKGVVPS